MTIQASTAFDEIDTRTSGEREAVAVAEERAIVVWRGDRLPYRLVPMRIAEISGRAARNALAAAHQEATEAINPLRERWYAARVEAARDLGFDDLAALHDASAAVRLDDQAVEAQRFLFESETVYFAALRRYLALVDIELGDATEADLAHILRGAGFAAWFDRRDLPRIVARIAGDLGLTLPDGLALPDVGGSTAFSSALGNLGVALAADAAGTAADEESPMARAYGLLFERLLLDDAWLEGRLGVPAEEVPVVADFLAFSALYRLRHDAALLLYGLRLHRGAAAPLARAYYSGMIGLLTGATAPESDYLAQLGAGFHGATSLRASNLAGGLRTWLEARHGAAWWREPAAGTSLRDLWSRRSTWDAGDVVAHLGYNAVDWRPVLRQIRTQLIGEMSGYGGPNITTRAGTRKV